MKKRKNKKISPLYCRAEKRIYDIISVHITLNVCATVKAIAGALPILLNSRMDVSAQMLTKAKAKIHERITFVTFTASVEISPREAIIVTAANPKMNLGNLSHI